MSADYKRFLVTYRFDDAEWNVELPAQSVDDARRRVGQLALGRVEGEIIATVPGAFGPLAALAAYARNAVSALSR